MTWAASAWADKPYGWVPSLGAGGTTQDLAAAATAQATATATLAYKIFLSGLAIMKCFEDDEMAKRRKAKKSSFLWSLVVFLFFSLFAAIAFVVILKHTREEIDFNESVVIH